MYRRVLFPRGRDDCVLGDGRWLRAVRCGQRVRWGRGVAGGVHLYVGLRVERHGVVELRWGCRNVFAMRRWACECGWRKSVC